MFPATRKYDKFYCSTCKEYLYLRAYQVSDKKVYCAEHLKKEEAENTKVTLILRKPNEDRKYILSIFGKVEIEQDEEEIERRGRAKSASKTKY